MKAGTTADGWKFIEDNLIFKYLEVSLMLCLTILPWSCLGSKRVGKIGGPD
jgi:hypothetical protein